MKKSQNNHSQNNLERSAQEAIDLLHASADQPAHGTLRPVGMITDQDEAARFLGWTLSPEGREARRKFKEQRG